MWMEHVAGIDVIGMQAAGVTLDDYVFYSCRVSCVGHQMFVPQLQGEPPLRTPQGSCVRHFRGPHALRQQQSTHEVVYAAVSGLLAA